MRLVRRGPRGSERPALLLPDGLALDVSVLVPDHAREPGQPVPAESAVFMKDPGVGMGQRPARYPVAGDVAELRIDGLGVQRRRLVPAPRACVPATSHPSGEVR